MADDLQSVADDVLDCVCTALADRGRPTCECFNVIGDPFINFSTCCECDDGVSGQLSIRLERLVEVDPGTLLLVDRVRPCKRGQVAADLTLVLSRCYPVVGEDGELPDVADQDAAARDMNTDAVIVWNALACCTGHELQIQEVAVDAAPEGGCSALVARIRVAVTPRPPAVES